MSGKPEDFVEEYERALATQDYAVAPLVHRDACVTFSSGAAHVARTPSAPRLRRTSRSSRTRSTASRTSAGCDDDTVAIYLFDFSWSGLIDAKPASGEGRGTSVIVREDGA
ncbi:MAG: hypothetical protein U0166_02320 [Acidobacteriota bacterium]